MTQALAASFGSFDKDRELLTIAKGKPFDSCLCLLTDASLLPLCRTDPREWSEADIKHWLNWAIKEFSLDGVNMSNFNMKGKEMCGLGKEGFLARVPPFMGDILWEHLDMMLKGKPVFPSPLSPLW